MGQTRDWRDSKIKETIVRRMGKDCSDDWRNIEECGNYARNDSK